KGLARKLPALHALLVCDDHDPVAVRREEREAFPGSGQQLQLLRRRDVPLHRRSAVQDSVPIEEDEAKTHVSMRRGENTRSRKMSTCSPARNIFPREESSSGRGWADDDAPEVHARGGRNRPRGSLLRWRRRARVRPRAASPARLTRARPPRSRSGFGFRGAACRDVRAGRGPRGAHRGGRLHDAPREGAIRDRARHQRRFGPRGAWDHVQPSRLRRLLERHAERVPLSLPRRRVRALGRRAGRTAPEAPRPPAARRLGRTRAARRGGARRVKRIVEFLESRGGLSSLWRAFADEPISVRRAWLFTLGSAALIAFLVQFASGLALALAYAPTPDHAWESVKAIQTRLPAGALVRGLHHWGASAMVLLVAAHMARTFVFGAYRRPRELNWLVGLALLTLVLGFGFTGYLLPWGPKGDWATVVGTRVPAALPLVGPAASRLMAGGPVVGAATLTRFYALHVVLLPLLAFSFIGVHLLLLRRHGHAGPTTPPDPREPFFPYQAARDGVVGVAVS